MADILGNIGNYLMQGGQGLYSGAQDVGGYLMDRQQNVGLSDGKINPGQAQLANMLLQGSMNTQNPLVAALGGFVGASTLSNIGRVQAEQAQAEAAAKKAAQAREFDLQERKFGLEQRKVDVSAETQAEAARLAREKFEQDQINFNKNLKLAKEKFNQQLIRDSQGQAVTKITDPETGVDRLFIGNSPVNDGLEKGMQWAVDNKGQKIAVPIPKQESQKARNIKELALEVTNRLLNNKEGVKANFGTISGIIPNVWNDAKDAETDINQLRAILTSDNLDLMSGVLSETDIKILQNIAAGGLAETASDEGALRELKRLKSALSGTKEVTKDQDIEQEDFTGFGQITYE